MGCGSKLRNGYLRTIPFLWQHLHPKPRINCLPNPACTHLSPTIRYDPVREIPTLSLALGPMVSDLLGREREFPRAPSSSSRRMGLGRSFPRFASSRERGWSKTGGGVEIEKGTAAGGVVERLQAAALGIAAVERPASILHPRASLEVRELGGRVYVI